MGKNHAERELEVFRKFAETRGWSQGAYSTEKQEENQRKPDLLIRAPSGSLVAMELVEILCEDLGEMLGRQSQTIKSLHTHLRGLGSELKARLKQQYANAQIGVHFSEDSTLTQRKGVTALILNGLASLPPCFEGEALRDDPALREVVRYVSVSRGEFNGPVLYSQSVRGLGGDTIVRRVAEKFGKRYETEHPIELLAYVDREPLPPDFVWRDMLREFLTSQPRPLPFRHLWIFDPLRSEILFECDGS